MTENEDGTIVACYLPTLQIAVPMEEQRAINIADKLTAPIFFYTTPEDIGLAEHKERWEEL